MTAMPIMIRGETLIEKWRVTFQRPPTIGKINPYGHSALNLQRKYEEQCREILIPAEELGLEVHEELYGGGTPPDDQTCLGSSSSKLSSNPLILCIKCLGCRTRHAAFSVEHLKLLHKVVKV